MAVQTGMRSIPYEEVTQRVAQACIDANTVLGDDMFQALERAAETEESPEGRETLRLILQNDRLAAERGAPMCQDTGSAVFFVDMGADVRIEGGLITDAINEGVRRGYKQGYLRSSIVKDPLDRVNTGDNTPAVIHVTPVAGDGMTIWFAPKGAGSENKSRARIFSPAEGWKAVVDYTVETMDLAGGQSCPPTVLGVGIGGDLEMCALIAKRALTVRRVGERHPETVWAERELELLERVNGTGVGPMGFGGRTTCIDVFIETFPCHIASLPVAVNIQCHANRHAVVKW